MRKRFTLGFLSFLMLLFSVVALASCDEDTGGNTNQNPIEECTHEWGNWQVVKASTCSEVGEEKRFCAKCEEFEAREINKSSHSFNTADCDTPKTCRHCSTTEGEALGHDWANADCEKPKTCNTCDTTEGEALGHDWIDATCQLPKICDTCGAIEGTNTGHNLSDERIELGDIVGCGAYADVYMCLDCDTIFEIYDFDINCENCEYNENQFELNGYYGESQIIDCNDCGAHLTYTYMEKMIDECNYEVIETYKAFLDSDRNKEISWTYKEYNHDCQYEYELVGDLCTEGYIATKTCSRCDYTYEYELQYDHVFDDTVEYTRIDLTTFGACGGFVEIKDCVACDYTMCANYYIVCQNYSYNNESTYTDDLGYEHTVYEMTCADCNVTYKADQYEIANTTECSINCYTILTIIVDSEVKLSAVNETGQSNHDYDETHELLGEDCSDGYHYIRDCKNCDDYVEAIVYEHKTDYKEICLDATCGGWINYYDCDRCDFNEYSDLDLYCLMNRTSESAEEIDGIEYEIVKYECINCDLNYTKKYWTEVDGCTYNKIIEYSFYIDNEFIISIQDNVIKEKHNYKVTKEFTTSDNDCEKGVNALIECEDCDIQIEAVDRHLYYYPEISFTEDGFCGAVISCIQCKICDKHFDITVNYGCEHLISAELIGYEDYDVAECEECHAYYLEKKVYGEPVNCQRTITTIKKIIFNNEEIANYSYSDIHEFHDVEKQYTLFGDDCDSGYVIYEQCKNCDYEGSQQAYAHDCEFFKVTHEDACEGFGFEYSVCKVCEKEITGEFITNGCELEYDNANCECSICGLKLTYTELSSEQNGCIKTISMKMEISINSTSLYSLTYDTKETNHTWVTTAERLGATCAEGLLIEDQCGLCGEGGSEYTVFQHYIVESTEQLDCLCPGACYYERKCLGCDKHFDAILYNYCSLNSDNTCEICCHTIIINDNEGGVNGDCEQFIARTITVKNTLGEVVFSKDTGFYQTEVHDYQYAAELLPGSEKCDDGVLVTKTCSRCDYYHQYEANGHTSAKVKVDLTQYGVCEHVEFYEWKCLSCNEVTGVEKHNDCWTFVGNPNQVNIYSCDTCNTTLKSYYTDGEKDSECYLTRTYIYELYDSNDELLYSTSYYSHEQEHNTEVIYTLLGEKCTDGVLVETKCIDCGYVHSSDTYFEHIILPEYIHFEDGCDSHCLQLNWCYCHEKVQAYFIDGFDAPEEGTEEIEGNEAYTLTYKCIDSICTTTITEKYYYINNVKYVIIVITPPVGDAITYEFTIS